MKLSSIRPNIQSSGNLEEQFFSIQDQGMIFDILRNKMYSNPILAICREISCNARDAHREIGKMDTPIQITLPTHIDPFFKVKDFGPGISPARMANVFIKYTASTKCDDNIQTGGFGLGAKTPFSYSDTFTIITNVDGVKYSYACFIDETKVGKLAMLNQAETNDENGTEIIIPVKSADFNTFSQWTESATRHWKVVPIIKGARFTYRQMVKAVEGDNWAIVISTDYNREVKIIIDGIEYPLDLSALKTYADSALISSLRDNLFLYFDIGELTLSASREQIYLDKPTQDKIKARIDKIINDMRVEIQKKIDACSDLWSANIYYSNEISNVFGKIKVLGKFKWQGAEVISNSESRAPGCALFTFTKGKYTRGKGNDPDKIVRGRNSVLSFQKSHVLYINDLSIKEPTLRHVKKAFDDNPGITGVQVICPSDLVTEEALNKSIGLDKLTTKRLSDITKATTRKYTNSARLIMFKFINSFQQVSYASMEEDTEEKIICLLDSNKDDGKFVILKNKKKLHNKAIGSLSRKFPKHSFYGVSISTPADRIEEEFSEVITIDDFIDEKVTANKTIDYVKIKQALIIYHKIDSKLTRNAEAFKKGIINQNSPFLAKLAKHESNLVLSRSIDSELLEIYEWLEGEIDDKKLSAFNKANPDFDLKKFDEVCASIYPLVEHVNTYGFESAINDIIGYVNLVDKMLETKV